MPDIHRFCFVLDTGHPHFHSLSPSLPRSRVWWSDCDGHHSAARRCTLFTYPTEESLLERKDFRFDAIHRCESCKETVRTKCWHFPFATESQPDRNASTRRQAHVSICCLDDAFKLRMRKQ